MKRIYLDYAATTPVDPRVARAMRDFESEFFGNPSSIHREGQQARARIDFARATLAKFIGAEPQEIIFTSGATESNNLAVQGAVSHYIKQYQIKPHVVTTKLEHQSVYNTVKQLRDDGVIDATFIDPDPEGLIDPNNIIRAITEHTVLVSTIFVSNEIGTILPVREISKLLAEVNARQKMKIMYHIDAVQAAKFLNCNVDKLGCDLLTLSGHKLYGPKGIGTLYVKSGVKLANLTYGGSQEYGRRPGTQNTVGIIGFAQAIDLLGSLEDRQDLAGKMAKLRDGLISELQKIFKVELNGPKGERRICDNVSITLYGIDQDALLTALDLAGIAASTGSACVSGSTEPSYVIQALGKLGNRSAATLRLTLGRRTTAAEIRSVAKAVNQIISQFHP